jgi:hypothetical protein
MLGKTERNELSRNAGLACEAQEDDDCSAELNHLLVAKPADSLAQLRARNRRDLVDHEIARLSQSVAVIGLDSKSEQGRIRRIGGEGANRHRVGRVEPIILAIATGRGLPTYPVPAAAVQISPRLNRRPGSARR